MYKLRTKFKLEPRRNLDWVYFLILSMIIIVITILSINSSNELQRIRIIEEKTAAYLDKNLCERIRFLESISPSFQNSQREVKNCDAYTELNIQRITRDE